MTGYGMIPACQTGKAATADMIAQISADTLCMEHKLHLQQAAAQVCSMCAYLMFVQRESGIKCGGWSLSETWGPLFVVCYFETFSLGSTVWLQTFDLSALAS